MTVKHFPSTRDPRPSRREDRDGAIYPRPSAPSYREDRDGAIYPARPYIATDSEGTRFLVHPDGRYEPYRP